jgi:DNA/RNA endonuclease YhcR with UshA esterase domain
VGATRRVAPTATPTPAPSPTAAPTPTPTDTPIPTPDLTTPIGQVDAGRAGEILTLRGRVAETASFSAGFQFALDDGTGQITLLLWADVYDALADAAGLNVGATVRTTGEIGEYEGTLQVVPEAASDVTVESASEGPQVPRREIGGLSVADAGALVEIEGTVSRIEPLGSGLRVILNDGSGEVLLLLWQNVAERVPDRELLVEGARVRAVGEVGEYQGALQVVPRLPFDVEVPH